VSFAILAFLIQLADIVEVDEGGRTMKIIDAKF